MTTTSSAERLVHGGKPVITSGISNWIATGLEPYANEPNPLCLGIEMRRHFISVILLSHLSGDQGDTCDEDHALNQEVYNSPGCGGRLVTSWERNQCARIFCITDDWGGPNAVTTVLFASEY